MDVRSFEETLRRVPDVEAARVVMEGSSPTEIHVLARPGKPAKQLVRDVQSVALAAFGTQVDRRIVSVVQISGSEIAGGDRPVVTDVSEQTDRSRMTVTVTLAWHDQQLVGTAGGPAASTTRLRLVAEAAVAALTQALDEDSAFAVSAVSTPIVGTEPVAIAQVVIVSGNQERLLVGSALVGDDAAKAMVRAVLDALNRQVPTLRRNGS